MKECNFRPGTSSDEYLLEPLRHSNVSPTFHSHPESKATGVTGHLHRRQSGSLSSTTSLIPGVRGRLSSRSLARSCHGHTSSLPTSGTRRTDAAPDDFARVTCNPEIAAGALEYDTTFILSNSSVASTGSTVHTFNVARTRGSAGRARCENPSLSSKVTSLSLHAYPEGEQARCLLEPLAAQFHNLLFDVSSVCHDPFT